MPLNDKEILEYMQPHIHIHVPDTPRQAAAQPPRRAPTAQRDLDRTVRDHVARYTRDAGLGASIASGIASGAQKLASGVQKLGELHERSYSESGVGDENDPNKVFPTTERERRSRDEEPPAGEARVVARLDPPPQGCHYALESRDDGSTAVVIEAGPPPEPVGDRRFHRLSGRDPLLAKMSRDARKFWGGKTHDKQNLVFVHYVTKNEKLELHGPDERGRYEVILISPDQPEIAANTPLGGSGQGQVIRSGSTPPESRTTGDAAKLRAINARNHAYWDRRK